MFGIGPIPALLIFDADDDAVGILIYGFPFCDANVLSISVLLFGLFCVMLLLILIMLLFIICSYFVAKIMFSLLFVFALLLWLLLLMLLFAFCVGEVTHISLMCFFTKCSFLPLAMPVLVLFALALFPRASVCTFIFIKPFFCEDALKMFTKLSFLSANSLMSSNLVPFFDECGLLWTLKPWKLSPFDASVFRCIFSLEYLRLRLAEGNAVLL